MIRPLRRRSAERALRQARQDRELARWQERCERAADAANDRHMGALGYLIRLRAICRPERYPHIDRLIVQDLVKALNELEAPK